MLTGKDADDYFWGTQGAYTGAASGLGMLHRQRMQKLHDEMQKEQEEAARRRKLQKEQAKRKREQEKLQVQRSREQEKLQAKRDRELERLRAKRSAAQARAKHSSPAKQRVSNADTSKPTALYVLSLVYGFIASFPLTVAVVKMELVEVWWAVLIAWFVCFMLSYGFFVTFKWVTYTITAAIVGFIALAVIAEMNEQSNQHTNQPAASAVVPMVP
jgi:cation transport ATPase